MEKWWKHQSMRRWRDAYAPVLLCLVLTGGRTFAQPASRGATAQVTPVTVAVVPEDAIQRNLYVDNQDPNASDNNPGTQYQPFQTLSRAVQSAEKLLSQDLSTKILIKPGVYRESVLLAPRGNQSSATLVLEATQKGS